jgi:hypothetical protein
MLFYVMATCWRQIGGYHCIEWSQWLFVQDLHSWWIPTFQKSVLLLPLRHQHRRLWHCVLPECWYPLTSTQLNCHNLAYSNLGIQHCKNYKCHTLILSKTLHEHITTFWFWYQQMFQAGAQKAPSAKICVLEVLRERDWI